MKKYRFIMVSCVVLLAMVVGGCGATPAKQAAMSDPPQATEPPATEALVKTKEDVVGVWQVAAADEDPLLLAFDRISDFSIFAGSKEIDYGFFTIRDEQLIFVTKLKTCDACKGTYQVYLTKQDEQPAQLRFVLNGQDPHASRATALDGKTASALTGALTGEVPVSTVEDVNGVWQVDSTSADPTIFTYQNGRFKFHNRTDGSFDGGTITVKDGQLTFNDTVWQGHNGTYIVFVKRQPGQPVWLRFISAGDDVIQGREAILQGRIWLLQSAP